MGRGGEAPRGGRGLRSGAFWRAVLGAAVGVFLAGAVALAVVLNLPVSPPTGLTSPTGTAAAPELVGHRLGRIAWSSGTAAPPAAPAVAVDFVDPARGWAIVGCGSSPRLGAGAGAVRCSVVRTRDHGLSWQVLWTTREPLAGIAFTSPRDGFAWTGPAGCGAAGACPTHLYATVDGGNTWTLRFAGGSTPWSSLAVGGPHSLWAVVGGELLHSSDGGRRWTLVPTPGCIPQTVTFRQGVGIAVGTREGEGVCADWTAGGGGWVPLLPGLDAPGMRRPFAAFLQDTGLDQALGGAAGARPLCDQGAAWPVGGRAAWLMVQCPGAEPGMMAVLQTVNGGASWRLAWWVAGCTERCQEAGETARPLGFLAGSAWRAAPGGVALSTDGGASFAPPGRLCPVRACVPQVQFLSPAQGFAATPWGVFATLNAGRSWQRLWPTTGPGPVVAADLVAPGLGLAVPAIAPDWILADRDGVWRPWLRLPGVAISLLDFLSPRQGFVYGTRQGEGILLDTERGAGFRVVPLPEGQVGTVQLSQLAFTSPQTGIAVDIFGEAWQTEDGGDRWRLLPALPLGLPQQVAWKDGHTAYAAVLLKAVRRTGRTLQVSGHLGLVVTQDGGKTWTPLVAWPWPAPGRGVATAVVAAQGSDLWTFAYGGLLHSTDGGLLWTEIRLPLARLTPESLTFASRSEGWMVTGAGQLLATGDGGKVWRQIAG